MAPALAWNRSVHIGLAWTAALGMAQFAGGLCGLGCMVGFSPSRHTEQHSGRFERHALAYRIYTTPPSVRASRC